MYKRFVLMIMLAGLFTGCQSPVQQPDERVPEKPAEPAGMTEESPVADDEAAASAAPAVEMDAAVPDQPESPIEERNKTMVLFKTSKGDIKIELDRERAPKTVENFLSYVESGHYNETIFHRVINGFMIQGGGFDASMNQKPAPRTVENEAKNGLSNVTGSIAMARTPDPHSASAQFFINVADNTNLDYPSFDGWGYCVFGQVVEGMGVVNAIKEVPTGTVGVVFAACCLAASASFSAAAACC